MFDPKIWGQVPFHFWTLCFFVFGSVVGSFLNVCIYRLPRGESVVHPASHCPHCGYSIPWHLNIPLVTWLWLRARCAHCGRPISIRYFLVELLTGTVFALCWLRFGPAWAGQAMVYCLFIAGLIAATFIDFEHFIIPDEITVGGMVAGFLLAFFVPGTHRLLGWPAVVFSLAFSSVIGSIVGVTLILTRKRDWSSRLPYGPYIALAAVIWIFGGWVWVRGIL